MELDSAPGGLFSKVRTFDTLRHYPSFRFLWASNLSYQIAFWMLLLVMSWLAYELTNSALLVALFTAARLSATLLGPFVGALADRMDRRTLIISGQILQVIVAVILAILTAAGLLQFWQLALAGFLEGIAFTIISTTSWALAMDIVGEKDITNAVALNTVAMQITRVVGPAVGGILIASLGPANCFWIAAGLCVLAAGTILKLKAPSRKVVASPGSVFQNIAEGFNYVIHNRDMVSVLSISIAANIFMWPAFQSFMPIFAKDNLGMGPEGLGFLLTVSGAGALLGALIIASLGDFRRKGLMYLWGTALAAIFFGTFAISRSIPLAMAMVSLSGLTSTAFGTMQATLMLILAPEEMRGRSSGFLQLAIGTYTFGALAMGVVANYIGASLTTGISCGILLIVVAAIALRMPNLRRL